MRLRSQLAWLQFSLVTACKTHRFTGTSPLFEASHWPKWSSPLSEDCVTEQSWAITNQDILITNVNSNRKLDLDFWDLISISKFETNLQIESQTPYQKTIFLIHGHFDLKMSHFDSKNCLPDVLSVDSEPLHESLTRNVWPLENVGISHSFLNLGVR
jgi:hypothetical protein